VLPKQTAAQYLPAEAIWPARHWTSAFGPGPKAVLAGEDFLALGVD